MLGTPIWPNMRVPGPRLKNPSAIPATISSEVSNVGISVEQYRSRVGSHDNFLKTKDALSRFKNRFWNVMLMMLYMNVFYLPTLKQVVGQYKIWNEVVFWFTQFVYYTCSQCLFWTFLYSRLALCIPNTLSVIVNSLDCVVFYSAF